MVSVNGLEKFKKAVEHVTQIAAVSQTSSFYAKIKDDVSFSWREWHVKIQDVPFVLNVRKDIEVDVNFGYDYADSPHQIFIQKTGMPLAPVYLHLNHLPTKGLLNPVSLEFLQVYRDMSMSVEDSAIPASVSKKILGYVHSYVSNFKNCYRSVECKSSSPATLLELLQSDDSHLPEREWVIRMSREGKKAVIVKAPSPSRAYERAILERDLPVVELKLQELEGNETLNTMLLQFAALKMLSGQFPIYTI